MNPIINEPIYKDFLAEKGIKSEETKRGYAQDLDYVRRYIKKEIPLATKHELKAFILDCMARKLTGGSINRYKAVLMSFYIWQIGEEQREDNPALHLKKLKGEYKSQRKQKGLTLEQRDKVFNDLKWEGGLHDYQISLAVLFGFKLGFRRFEIAKVRWDDIDFDKREIFVKGKGGKEATIDLTPTILEKLQDYKAMVDKAGVDTGWVFFKLIDPSKHTVKENVAKWFKIIEKRTGIKMASHDGRRGFCTALNEAGIPDLTAILATRHESVDMFSRYVMREKKKVKEAVNKAIS